MQEVSHMSQDYDTTNSRKNKHLNEFERGQIEALIKENLSHREIAGKIHRNNSTVSREIQKRSVKQRNYEYVEYQKYFAETAQNNYRKNRDQSGAKLKLYKDQKLVAFIEECILSKKWPPDVIVGFIAKEGLRFKVTVTAKTIYNYIDNGLLKVKNIDLPKKVTRKPRKTKFLRTNTQRHRGTNIEKRPEIVNNREEFGHWEMDTVIGINKTSEPVLLTLNERLTRDSIIIPLVQKTQEEVIKAIDSLEVKFGNKFPKIFRSITSDNGTEFIDFAGIEASKLEPGKTRTQMYYAHPYSAFERGTNENTNGIIRRFIPKGQSLHNFSQEKFQVVQDWINNLPRKKLGYFSSKEMFQARLNELFVA
jgi:IS30 family transposase